METNKAVELARVIALDVEQGKKPDLSNKIFSPELILTINKILDEYTGKDMNSARSEIIVKISNEILNDTNFENEYGYDVKHFTEAMLHRFSRTDEKIAHWIDDDFEVQLAMFKRSEYADISICIKLWYAALHLPSCSRDKFSDEQRLEIIKDKYRETRETLLKYAVEILTGVYDDRPRKWFKNVSIMGQSSGWLGIQVVDSKQTWQDERENFMRDILYICDVADELQKTMLAEIESESFWKNKETI